MDSRPPDKSPGLLARLFDSASNLAAAAIVAAAIFLAGKYLLFDELDERIRARVETGLQEQFVGLHVQVASARRVEGQGIEVRGITLRNPHAADDAPPWVHVEQLFVECETKLPDMIAQPPVIRRAEVRGVRLRVERQATGQWNLMQLLPLRPSHGPLFPAVVKEVAVEVVDASRPGSPGITLRDWQYTLEPMPASATTAEGWQVRGQGSGDHFEKLVCEGTIPRSGGAWSVQGTLEGLEFTPRLRSVLPTECDTWLQPLAAVRGRTRWTFQARQPLGTGPTPPPIDFDIAGQISEGRIDDDRLGEPLTEVSAQVHMQPSGVRIDNLRARCGAAEVKANVVTQGLGPQMPLTADVQLVGWSLERIPTGIMPAAAEEEVRRLSLHGMADITGAFTFDGRQWSHQASATLRDVSLMYPQFPFPLTEGVGKIQGLGDKLRVELQALAGPSPVTIRGEIPVHRGQGSSWIDVQTERPLAIDERLLAALTPAAQQVIRAFHPRGEIVFAAQFARTSPTAALQRWWRIDLQDISLAHEAFPYPLEHVRGVLECQDGQWTFRQLEGRNDGGRVTGAGSWTRRDDGAPHLELDLTATNLPLDDDLRKALSPAAQKLWSHLRPRGALDQLAMRVASVPGKPGALSLTLRGEQRPPQSASEQRGVSLEPLGNGYRLNDMVGEFSYQNGKLEFTKVRATHGRAAFAFQGSCEPKANGGWSLRLPRFSAERWAIDRELIDSLPADWAAAASKWKIDGPLAVAGAVALDWHDQTPPAERFLCDWDVTVDIENGRLEHGLAWEHVFGGARLIGRGTPLGFAARGDLQIDSLVTQGVQVSQIRGPFVVDNRRVVFGSWTEPENRARPPQSVKAKVFGGNLALDGSRELTEEGRFSVQASLDDANLWNLTLELMPGRNGLAGKGYGTISLQGSAKGMHTWRGTGAVRLRDADIYEVPVFLAMFRLLNIRRQDNLVFRDANMDFRVTGDMVQFDRLDFHSEIVSLKGRGHLTMTEKKPLDLQFYTQMGRDEVQVPLLRPLLGEASRSFLLIEVTGSAESPQVTRKAFPAINDHLRQLFPELAEGSAEKDAVSRPGWLKKWR